MIVVKKISEIRKFLSEKDKKIAFVPTMGCLHEGHLSLISQAREVADIVVVSIFVNKTQFNEKSDFEKYPRQLESDIAKLEACAVDYLFAPEDVEIFPQESMFKITPIDLADCLCGKYRAGHFDGVALIITKLFNIIKPQIAIFGEKDFQQLQIIKNLAQDLNFDVEILSAKTMREKSGLAMSSRNQRLDETNKIKAANIYKILNEIKDEVMQRPLEVEKILQNKQEELLKIGFEKVDYLEIREEKSLKLVKNFDAKKTSRIFIAVYLSGVRLIDNQPI